MTHFLLRRGPVAVAIVVLHVLAFAMALATFTWYFLHLPYDECPKGKIEEGCKTEKAAVPMDGVLMYLSGLHLTLTHWGLMFHFLSDSSLRFGFVE